MISQNYYLYCGPTQNVQFFLKNEGESTDSFLEVNIHRYNEFFFMDLHLSNIFLYITEPLQEEDGSGSSLSTARVRQVYVVRRKLTMNLLSVWNI